MKTSYINVKLKKYKEIGNLQSSALLTTATIKYVIVPCIAICLTFIATRNSNGISGLISAFNSLVKNFVGNVKEFFADATMTQSIPLPHSYTLENDMADALENVKKNPPAGEIPRYFEVIIDHRSG